MKQIVLALTLLVSSSAFAQNMGESDNPACQCKTCIANGACKENQADSDRFVSDKGRAAASKPKGNNSTKTTKQ